MTALRVNYRILPHDSSVVTRVENFGLETLPVEVPVQHLRNVTLSRRLHLQFGHTTAYGQTDHDDYRLLLHQSRMRGILEHF